MGLGWTASTGPDVAGYRVYRNGSATPLNSSLVTTTSYTDSTVAGGTTYSYAVTAVNTSGVESARSAAVSVTTPVGTAGVGRAGRAGPGERRRRGGAHVHGGGHPEQR